MLIYKKGSVLFDTHDGLPYRCQCWILRVAPGFLITSCVLAGCGRIIFLPGFPASFRSLNCSGDLVCALVQFCFNYFSPFHFILHVYFSAVGGAQNVVSARSSQSSRIKVKPTTMQKLKRRIVLASLIKLIGLFLSRFSLPLCAVLS